MEMETNSVQGCPPRPVSMVASSLRSSISFTHRTVILEADWAENDKDKWKLKSEEYTSLLKL